MAIPHHIVAIPMIFYGYARNYQAFTLQRLYNESQTLGIPWKNISGHSTVPLEPGLLWFRNFGLDYSDHDLINIQQNYPQLRVINPLASVRRLRDKYQQYQDFVTLGLPVIPTQLITDFCQLHLNNSWAQEGPLVLKTRRGLQGKGVFLHSSRNELLTVWRRQHQLHPLGQHFLVQPFIPSPKLEMRLFFWGSERILLEKTPGSDFRHNARFARFALANWQNLSKNEKNLLEKIIIYCHCFYGAIDFFCTDQGLIVIEVNSMPGIQSLESCTRRNIARELLLAASFQQTC